LPDEVTRLLVPFTIPSGDRRRPFDKRMELAAVFCLAEINREKGRGLISKKAPEEIVFIAEICYPLWLVPWKGSTLLFDGFGTWNHTISFDILPDAAVFIHEIKGCADKFEAYSAFLSSNLDYFKGFSGKGQKTIIGLIMDQPFNKDFFSYLPRTRQVRKALQDVTILSPVLDETAVKASVKELSDLREALSNDVNNLRGIIKLLVKTTQNHTKKINTRIRITRSRSENEIVRFKSESMKKIEELRKEYDERIVQISEEASNLIHILGQERVKLESDKKRLLIYAERCETEISAASVRRDEAEEENWRLELERCRQELSEIDRKLEEIDKRITDAEPSRDLRISRLKSEYNSQTEAILSGLKKIEAARDAQLRIGQEALKSLEDSTSAAIGQIDRLMETRNLALAELNNIGFQLRRRKMAMVYLPFFLACYRQELKRRYIAFPPSVANSMSGVTKIKGALKSFKVGMVLEESSIPIAKLVNRVVSLIEQNPMLEERVMSACLKTNIVRSKKLRRSVDKGLEMLSMEDWLSEGELKFFNERLEETKP
jgi:hypothetical protein